MAVAMTDREDLGRMIAKVQDDLRSLRTTAALRSHAKGDGLHEDTDSQALESVLTRTEKNMQLLAEKVMDSSHGELASLPAVVQRHAGGQHKHPSRQSRLTRRRSTRQDTTHLSPGEQSQMKQLQQLMSRPGHPVSRQLLNHYYQLPFNPPCQQRHTREPTGGRVMLGTTVDHLTTLPRVNRRNALATPPPIEQKDAHKGLFSLLQRGLIPPAAELVLSPPPVAPRRALLHSANPHQHSQIAEQTVPASVKLDPDFIPLPDIHTTNTSAKSCSSSSPDGPQEPVHKLTLPPILSLPTSPLADMPTFTHQDMHILINSGRLASTTNEFAVFKSANTNKWHLIQQVLDQVVQLCQDYMIPVCILKCDRVLEVSRLLELGVKVARRDLLEMIANRNDVNKLISAPGRRFRGHDGEVAAANKIRATYLMYREVKKYKLHHKKKWAADVVGTAWMMFMKLYKIKRQLKLRRETELAGYRSRAAELRRSWPHLQTSNRCVVHIPSLGLPAHVRSTIHDMYREQSMQIGRICDCYDERVHVVYVSPVELDEDTMDYYIKLLSIRQDTPTDEDTPTDDDDIDTQPGGGLFDKERLHIVVPENLEVFRHCHMSLSTVLLYSPKCLARIKRLVAGRPAYIVAGLICQDDIALAHKLDLPLLGSEPEVSALYSSKAGARQLLKEAGLPILPPYEPDIFSEKKLIQSLAKLVTNHLLVPRWLFKLNYQVKGHGFAYCDVIDHLSCYQQVLRESQRYGGKWSRPWAQEQSLQLIASELPGILAAHGQVVSHTHFSSWHHFVQHFIREGGLIEATPPSDSSTALTVELLVEPNGNVKVMTTADKICGYEYEVSGGSVPQCSLDHAQLMTAVDALATACKDRGILGHVSLDFITFIHPHNLEQALWCVDFDLHYSDLLAVYHMTSHVIGLYFHDNTGILELHPPAPDKPQQQVFAILLPHLHHANMSFLYPTVFFQVCKAHHIGYDSKERVGTVFGLADEKHRNYISMACVEESLVSVMDLCAANLNIINQELSTATLAANTNFKVIANDLQEISQLMKLNL